jgi:hypothetical protein
MESANPPRNRVDAIVVARYAPLVLPQPMNSLLVGDYLKYIPKFTGEEDITAEEHLLSFTVMQTILILKMKMFG